jgi:outer membrane protein insertion porin family
MDRMEDAVSRLSKSLLNQIAGVEQVESVQIKGTQRIEAEAVLGVVESKGGERLDYDKLDRDLRAIYRMGFFKDVKIETENGPKGKIVTFHVDEKPSIGNIAFRGNKKINSEDLIKECGVKQYSILNLSEIRQSVNRLKDYYRQKGYYNVEMKESLEDLPRNEVGLIYEVTEGEKVYLRKIQFVGTTRFSDRELKKVMETSEKGIFSFITDSGVLDKKTLEFDLQKITTFYHNHGYIKARTGEPQVAYKEEDGLIVTIEVIEGDPFTVRDVEVKGDFLKPPEELLRLTKIKKEKVFSREVVRQDVMALKDAYANEGYAYAEVGPVIKEDENTHQVDIAYTIKQGKKVRFERININGNTNTRDKVIRRELEVYEGELFSGEGLRLSTENLHRLGYFEDVDVQTKQGNQEDSMILDLNVKERPTGSFSLGAGYGGYEGGFGVLQVSQNNLFGTGQKLTGAAKLGSKIQEIDLKFTEPWLFDKRLSFGVDLTKWQYEYPEYSKDAYGGALRLGFPIRRIDRYTGAQVKYTYENADITDVDPNAPLVLQDIEGKTVSSSMLFSITRDSKDRAWNPTKGSVNSLSFEYAGGVLGGEAYFNRYEARSQWFFLLPWSTVFMGQGRIGYVEERSGGVLPDYQKYRLGGINSLRGYDYWSVGLTDPATGQTIGGTKMMVYNFEFRFPLIKEQGVAGILFFDAGNVYGDSDSYSFSDIRKSAGVGVRWYSPVGPIRLEYGFVLDRQPGDPAGNMEFTIGGLF